LSRLNKKLILPGLIVGSFMPDIEVPVLIIFFRGVLPDHLLLHSLVGGLTIGTIMSIFITVIFYPFLTSLISYLDRTKVKKACRLTPSLMLSCMLGNLFHILLDIPMHPFNPVLWPFIDPHDIVGPLVLVFAIDGDIDLGFLYAQILNYIIMGSLMITILVKSRKNLWEQILIGKTYLIPEK
jgi:hypothetical protein